MTRLWGHLITKRVYVEIYKDCKALYEGQNLDKPVRLKWAFAAEFCNDLSIAQGLTPCYYLNGEVVDCLKGNYDIRGIDYECRIKNNGWRLPTYEEIKYISKNKYKESGNDWLWTNDEGEWVESRIIIRTGRGYTAKELEELFGLEIGSDSTGIHEYDTEAISHDPEEKLAFIPIKTFYKDDFENK
ncbi:MAG: hypothetical protein IKZ57_07100 [Spirochaetia bacterium]|nr:hypothetical protein [Spirochaetia bacterium]